jgi:hypothetical protein
MPVCLAAYWSLQALGVGLYALFPNPVDARGPMALLRTLITAAYIVPALALAGAAAAFGGGPLAVSATVCFAFVAEGFLTIEFAAHRFTEKGATMALVAESA